MGSKLGPLEINCDAPPYPVVTSCVKLGVEKPQDVRWLGTSEQIEGEAVERTVCTCKEKLPELNQYEFTFASGDVGMFNIGQCKKCKTVYWNQI